MPWKKLIIIGVISLVVIVAGYLLWTTITSPVSIPEEQGEEIPQGDLPSGGTAGTGGTIESSSTLPTSSGSSAVVSITKVSHASAASFWLGTDGRIFYFAPDGTVSVVGAEEDTQISPQKMSGIRDIQRSPWSDQVLAAFGPVGAASWGIFSAGDRSWSPLPGDITAAAWGTKNGELIATAKTTDGFENLVVVDLTKSSAPYRILVKRFAWSGVSFRVQLPQTLIIAEKPSGLSTSRIWSLDLKTLKLTQTAAAEAGLTSEVSGDQNILFRFSPAERMVYIASTALKSAIETLPGKCFSGATSTEAYCFTPRGGVPDSYTLPDDYYQKKFFTNDALYRISTSTPESITLPLASRLDASDALYANGSIYFLNRTDDYVYRISNIREVKSETTGL